MICLKLTYIYSCQIVRNLKCLTLIGVTVINIGHFTIYIKHLTLPLCLCSKIEWHILFSYKNKFISLDTFFIRFFCVDMIQVGNNRRFYRYSDIDCQIWIIRNYKKIIFVFLEYKNTKEIICILSQFNN